jgi:hypothetical protein
MDVAEVFVDAFNRVTHSVHGVLRGLSQGALVARLDDEANSICWLIWHLTRVEDDHVADVADTEQVWITGGWHDRFGLPFDRVDTGYGHGPSDVAAVRTDADLLLGYYDAVADATLGYVSTLSATDLDRIVDRRWDPPVTLGVRLVSVVGDTTEHVGQAEFVRGILERSGTG